MTGVGALRLESMCCGVGAEFLENWDDVIAPLPEMLREVAIQQDRAEHEAQELRIAEALARFAESRRTYVDPLPARLSKAVNPDVKGSPFAI